MKIINFENIISYLSLIPHSQSVPASGSGVENHYSRTFRQHSDTSGDVHLQGSDNSDYSTLDQNQVESDCRCIFFFLVSQKQK